MEKLALSLTEIDNTDSGIYHHLAPVITNSQGLQLFENISKIVGTEKDLYKLVNFNGFTPILLYIQEFASRAETVYNEYKNNIIQNYIVLHAAKRPQQPQQLQNPFMAAGINPNRYGTHNYLSPQETAKLEIEAEKEFQNFISKFLETIQVLVAFGADLGDKVQKLKQYRALPDIVEKPQKESIEEEQNADSMDIESALPSIQSTSSMGMLGSGGGFGGGFGTGGGFGGGFGTGGGFGGGLLGRGRGGGNLLGGRQQPRAAGPVGQPKESDHYGPQGKQTALHLIMSYPHARLVSLLLECGRIDVNHQDVFQYTALNLLINNFNPQP